MLILQLIPPPRNAFGPCLRCGGHARVLQPGRKRGFPVYCPKCATIPRPEAIGAAQEEKRTKRAIDRLRASK